MAAAIEKEDQQAAEEGRLYKGERVKVKDLTVKDWLIVQTIDGQWGDFYRRKRPTFMVITDLKTAPGGITVMYYNARGPDAMRYHHTALLPMDTEVNVLTGRQGAKLAQEMVAWEKANMYRRLVRPGLQLGADPEIFVVDKKNEIIPAWKFLPEKAKGLSIQNSYGGTPSRLYWDGFQAEFTTRPATCLAYFMDEVAFGLQTTRTAAKKYDKHARLSAESVVPVDMETLETAEDKFVEFGCMPSMNVYGFTGTAHSGRAVPIRFAGGHIHLGVSHPDLKPRLEECIKAMDAILGVACVSFFEKLDNPARREFYGLPGEYRLPAHGLEYRTLSNAWLVHPLVGNMVMELARGAFAVGYNRMLKHWKTPEEDVINIIKASNAERARESIEANKAFFDAVLGVTILGSNTKLARKCFMEGLDSFLKDPTDIENNWALSEPWITHCEGPNMNWTKAQHPISRGEKV